MVKRKIFYNYNILFKFCGISKASHLLKITKKINTYAFLYVLLFIFDDIFLLNEIYHIYFNNRCSLLPYF